MPKGLLVTFEELGREGFLNSQVNSIYKDLLLFSDVEVTGYSKDSELKDLGAVVHSNHNYPPLIRRSRVMLGIAARVWLAAQRGQYDYIYAINFPGLVLAKFFKTTQIIYHALEIFSGMSSVPSYLRIALNLLEKYFTKGVAIFYIPSKIRKAHYSNLIGERNYRISYNSPSFSEIELCSISRKIKEEITFVYAGGLGYHRDIRNLLDGISLYSQHSNLPVALYLYTNLSETSKYHADLMHHIKHNTHYKIKFMDTIKDRASFISEVSKYHIMLGVYNHESLNNRLCAPTKIIDACLAETLWLCSELPGSLDALESFGNGVLTNTNNSQEIFASIIEITKAEFIKKIDIKSYKTLEIEFLTELLEVKE